MTTTNNIFAGKGLGYDRAELEDRLGEASRKTDLAKKGLMSDHFFNASASASHTAFATPRPESTDPVYVDDLMPSVQFEVPQIKAEPKIDLTKPQDKPADPSAERNDINAAAEKYLKADAAIKTEFIKAVRGVDRDVGDMLAKVTGPTSSGSTLAEVAKAADPGVGDLYTIISKMMKQPDTEHVRRVLDSAINNLQKATDVQNNLAKTGKASPPAIDWNALGKVNPSQKMMDFMERNIDEDPFMQALAEQDEKVKIKEANVIAYDDHYHEYVSEEKIAYAVNKNDTEMLDKFFKGDQQKVALAEKGDIKAAMKEAPTFDAGDVMLAKGLDVGGMKADKARVVDISEGVREVAKALMPPKQDREPDMNQLVPQMSSAA